ncbi:MAG: flavodoxin family protein [Melioribacter sp.]|uniref:flavodoxin family protein n=1 Tax=Rosettibacter primus TaxID=3111523 RepID=UPI00247CD91E|nr:flavodoxin family protein [Melioribacter sp.]
MGKVLVLYYSNEGHTKKMAEFVAEGAKEIPETEVRLKSIYEANKDDIFWCDGLALGSPTYLGTVASEMKKFWEDLLPYWQKLDGKIGCAFSSQGGWGGGAELTCQTLMNIMINYGFLVFGVTDYSGKQFTAHYGATQAGEPRQEKEIESCKRLGKRLAEWVAVFVDGRKNLHPLNNLYKRNPWD